ncbi:hypothetical protein LXA43DRAFT_904190 [Ganoderma leucocontextum]|nr:hypothetical protein LXA43DRAFT_904190 [Ganoderma leucocontextum]
MLPDEEHFVKEGPTDLIAWEFLVYSLLQDSLDFPTVCERILDSPERQNKGLLLHSVICFRDIFHEEDGPGLPPPLEPFSYVSTAFCVSHLIRYLRFMHCCGVLHRDVHPGNVGLLCAPSSSLPTNMKEVEVLVEQGYLFTPTFIDYEWSTWASFHPRLHDMPIMAAWSYLSDRVLREPGVYSPADDLESLAYTLLEFRLGGELPWSLEIEAKASSYDYDVESVEHRDFVIKTRTRYLEETSAVSRSLERIEKCLLDFIKYARSLGRKDIIDYRKWEHTFQNSMADHV